MGNLSIRKIIYEVIRRDNILLVKTNRMENFVYVFLYTKRNEIVKTIY